MHAASEPSDHDAGTGDNEQSARDAAPRELWAMEQPPSDEPVPEVVEAPVRRPIISLFTRRAFLSKDTGRWHRLTGGRDHDGDQPTYERERKGDG